MNISTNWRYYLYKFSILHLVLLFISISIAAIPYSAIFFDAGNLFARSFLDDFGGFFVLLTPVSLIVLALGIRYSWHVKILKENVSFLQPMIQGSIARNMLWVAGIFLKSIVYTVVSVFVGFFVMVMATFASDAGPNAFSSILFFVGLVLPGVALLLSVFWS